MHTVLWPIRQTGVREKSESSSPSPSPSFPPRPLTPFLLPSSVRPPSPKTSFSQTFVSSSLSPCSRSCYRSRSPLQDAGAAPLVARQLPRKHSALLMARSRRESQEAPKLSQQGAASGAAFWTASESFSESERNKSEWKTHFNGGISAENQRNKTSFSYF